eukprot:GEMP01003632.1.p1 GENE.GEMP01003632.1~~GEMP01003632.1.p1  ORF type:complete len:1262 (+),score=265.51 GEMP01003632.1:51-3788(+)
MIPPTNMSRKWTTNLLDHMRQRVYSESPTKCKKSNNSRKLSRNWTTPQLHTPHQRSSVGSNNSGLTRSSGAAVNQFVALRDAIKKRVLETYFDLPLCFSALDTNNDGVVTIDAFCAAMTELGIKESHLFFEACHAECWDIFDFFKVFDVKYDFSLYTPKLNIQAGETIEVFYRLDVDMTGSAYYVLRRRSQLSMDPFIALVPQSVTSHTPEANAAAACVVLEVDKCGTKIAVVIPDEFYGYFEFRLFSGFRLGQQLGVGLPIVIDALEPLPPQHVTVNQEDAATTVDLSWDPPDESNVEHLIFYEVRAVNRVGASTWSETLCYRTSAQRPSKIVQPTVANKGMNSVRLRWPAPLDGGSVILEHRIYGYEIVPFNHGGGGAYSDAFTINTANDAPSHLVSGLRANTEYAFIIAAINEAGESEKSEELVVCTGPSKPGQVTDVVVDSTGGRIVVKWTPAYASGAKVIYHHLRLVDVRNGESILKTDNADPEFEIQLEGNIEYEVRVRAVNRVGTGSWSTPAIFLTPPCPPRTPEAPRIVGARHGHVHLSWEAPEDGGSPITNYFVHCIPPKGLPHVHEVPTGMGLSKDGDYVHLDGFVESCVVDADTDLPYEFSIQAVNSLGKSNVGAPQALLKMDPKVPPRPGVPKVVDRKGRRMTLVWDPPQCSKSKILRYRVYRFGQRVPEKCFDTRTARERWEVPVHSDDTYCFRVSAIGDGGEGQCSAYSEEYKAPMMAPDPCTKVRVVDVYHHGMSLTWQPPHDHNDIVDYEVLTFEAPLGEYEGAKFSTVDNTRSAQCSYEVCNLKGNTRYFFQVRGVNEVGTGDASQPSPIFTTCPVAPDSPSKPKIDRVDQTCVSLRWNAPKDGGSAVIRYRILAVATESGMEMEEDATELTAHTVEQLEPNTTYTFKVQAVSTVGASEWSVVSDPVCTGAAPPSQCGRPEVVSVGPGCVLVRFADPQDNGSPVHTWRCFSIVGGEVCDVDITVGEENEGLRRATITGLLPEEYSFIIQAINAAGTSPLSPPSCTARPEPSPEIFPAIISVGPDTAELHCPSAESCPPETQYVLQVAPAPRGGCPQTVAAGEFELLNLDSCTEYAVTLRLPGCPAPAPTIFTTLPDKPSECGRPLVSVVDNGLDLQWLKPESTGGSPIIGYRIIVLGNSEGELGVRDIEVQEDGTPTASCVMQSFDLVPGKMYSFQVVAITKTHTSNPSPSSEVVQMPWDASVPSEIEQIPWDVSPPSEIEQIPWDAS